ncbi:MAG: type II toxin-antitoxin system RelE/ParE family toxin [Sulfuricurvum sp.]|nr:type II toxin-antitoxin system RelE/ParE family toxin [Sulfuricurvum sp.]
MAKTFSVFWTNTAQNDLSAILEYIHHDSPQNARSILKSMKDQAQKLNTFPERGRIVPELREFGILIYRELIIDRWRVMYKIDADHVYVLSVIDSRQNAEDILFHRFIG